MKRTFKKYLSLMLVLSLVLTFGLSTVQASSPNLLEKIKAEGKLVVATSPDYAPYEFLDLEGKPVGADISLVTYIAEQLGVTLVLEAMDFDTVLAAVAASKVDLCVAGMVPKEERKSVMDFTDVYYNDGNQGIIILKSNADQLKTLEDFKGKLVAAQNGTLQQTLVSEQLPWATMEPINKIPDAIMMVMTGKVAGLALASVVSDQYVANYEDLTVCETPFVYDYLGVAMATPKDSPELVAALNTIIKVVIEQGLYKKWMGEAIELSNSMSE